MEVTEKGYKIVFNNSCQKWFESRKNWIDDVLYYEGKVLEYPLEQLKKVVSEDNHFWIDYYSWGTSREFMECKYGDYQTMTEKIIDAMQQAVDPIIHLATWVVSL
jgi:hypothetical protein